MMKLPKIPYSMEKNKRQVVSMGSINYSKMTNDGDIADSGGISGRYYPYITTAKASEAVRVGVVANKNIVAMTVFRGKFVEIDNAGYVYYDGLKVGVLPTDEVVDWANKTQFAAINTKLVIMPFKKYLDVSKEDDKSEEGGVKIRSLGAKITTTTETKFGANSVTLAGEAAQSYRMIGGGITFGNRFTALQKKTLGTYNGSPYYLAVYADPYDNSRIRMTPVFNAGHFEVQNFWGNTLNILCDRKTEKRLRETAFIYFHNKERFDSIIECSSIYKGSVISGGYGRYSVSLEISSTGGIGVTIDAGTELYLATEHDLGDTEGETYSRIVLKNKYTGRSYEGLVPIDSATSGSHLYVKTGYIYMEAGLVDLKYSLYTGMIDNGGWAGDFRDFLSVGRGVTVSADLSYMMGSVATVGQNYFTVVDKKVYDDMNFGNAVVTVTADENTNATLGALFKVGDVVNISGCSIAENNIDFQIESISEDGKKLFAASDIFTATPDAAALAEETGGVGLVIERRIPTLDYICESDNRLYGCSNEDNTIYVSALGDPTNIYTYQGMSTDSCVVPVASEEPFTGCCPYDGGVMFWKENKLHKLLGSNPQEYALYTYNIDGVQEGSHKSLQNIGEVLYYKGVRGVYAFNGSPQLISSNFGDKYFTDAVAGNDGEHYLISMKDEGGNDHFFSYDTRSGLWVREGDGCVTAFARQGKDVYMLENGEVYLYGAEETPADAEWFIQFTPIYETIEGQKSYSRIRLRIELPLESYMVISVRCDGGRWAECGKIVGRVESVVPVVVPINRCDKFELRIEGKGPCTIHSILREYYVAADNR